MQIRLIRARNRRPRWRNVVNYETLVENNIREACRVRISGDERKKKGDSG